MFRPALTLCENRHVRRDAPPGARRKWPPIEGKIPNSEGEPPVPVVRQPVARACRGRQVHFHSVAPESLQNGADGQHLAHAYGLQPDSGCVDPLGRQARMCAEAMADVLPVAAPPAHAHQILGQHQQKDWGKKDTVEPDAHGRTWTGRIMRTRSIFGHKNPLAPRNRPPAGDGRFWRRMFTGAGASQ